MYVNQTAVSACGTALPWLQGSLTVKCGQAGGPRTQIHQGPPGKGDFLPPRAACSLLHRYWWLLFTGIFLTVGEMSNQRGSYNSTLSPIKNPKGRSLTHQSEHSVWGRTIVVTHDGLCSVAGVRLPESPKTWSRWGSSRRGGAAATGPHQSQHTAHTLQWKHTPVTTHGDTWRINRSSGCFFKSKHGLRLSSTWTDVNHCVTISKSSRGSSEALSSRRSSPQPQTLLGVGRRSTKARLCSSCGQKVSLCLITYGIVIIQWFPALTQTPQPLGHGGQTEFSQRGSGDTKALSRSPRWFPLPPSVCWEATELNLKWRWSWWLWVGVCVCVEEQAEEWLAGQEVNVSGDCTLMMCGWPWSSRRQSALGFLHRQRLLDSLPRGIFQTFPYKTTLDDDNQLEQEGCLISYTYIVLIT